MASDAFHLSLLQHAPTPCDIATSVSRIETQLRTVAAQGSQLLLVPEASLTGYNITPDEAKRVALHANGKTTEKLAAACRQHNIALAYGFVERDDHQLYNTVQVIDRNGERVAHYRKTHLWGELDRALFTAGDDLAPVFELHGWQFGLLICYDVEFPETSRRLAFEGAETILVPTALMTPWAFVAEHMIRVRAAENQLFIAYANYCGAENGIHYEGLSCIVSPAGNDLSRAKNVATCLTAELKRGTLEDIRAALPYHQDRRPDLYS
ncbi:MAG: carbon-nitrogen hydrolase family protein [Granulosicoccus sp.]